MYEKIEPEILQTPKKSYFSLLKNKIKQAISHRISEDKEIATMMNEMGIDSNISTRSWKRHSALVVYSKYQVIK
jgi:hypothetical protein